MQLHIEANQINMNINLYATLGKKLCGAQCISDLLGTNQTCVHFVGLQSSTVTGPRWCPSTFLLSLRMASYQQCTSSTYNKRISKWLFAAPSSPLPSLPPLTTVLNCYLTLTLIIIFTLAAIVSSSDDDTHIVCRHTDTDCPRLRCVVLAASIARRGQLWHFIIWFDSSWL